MRASGFTQIVLRTFQMKHNADDRKKQIAMIGKNEAISVRCASND
jgi:hypothetical protein